MDYAIEFPETPTLPVAESNKAFPVGRIYCVGRNYAEHAREMGHDPTREPPFFFMKPADAIVPSEAEWDCMQRRKAHKRAVCARRRERSSRRTKRSGPL